MLLVPFFIIPSIMREWSVVYLIASVGSSISCFWIVWRLSFAVRSLSSSSTTPTTSPCFKAFGRRSATLPAHLPPRPRNSSAVHFVLLMFFGSAAFWNSFRGLFSALLLIGLELPSDFSGAAQGLNEAEWQQQEARFDVMGMRGVADAQTISDWRLIGTILARDVALMSMTLWLFPMTYELFHLAKVTMDRGVDREQLVIRRYNAAVFVGLLLFVALQISNTVVNDGYNAHTLVVANLLQCTQLLALLLFAWCIVYLKCKRREMESVHGEIRPSPLYVRLKRLLVVFSVFSLQFQVFSIWYLLVQQDVEMAPIWLIGSSTLLFRCLGMALAFVMGCSQDCVVRSLRPWIPNEYVEQFEHQLQGLVASDDRGGRSQSGADPAIVAAPKRNPVFVFTDIESSSALWAIGDGSLMRAANELHDEILRTLLMKCRGYEITTVGDAFQLAFATIKDAVEYCIEAQLELLEAKWPKRLGKCGISSVKTERVRGKAIFKGLRVRMGIHDAQEHAEGALVTDTHPITGKTTYTGLSEVIANEVGDLGHGGQILVTARIAVWLTSQRGSLLHDFCLERCGVHHLSQMGTHVEVFQVLPAQVRARKRWFSPLPFKAPIARNRCDVSFDETNVNVNSSVASIDSENDEQHAHERREDQAFEAVYLTIDDSI